MSPDVVVALALIGGSVVFLATAFLIGLCRAAARKRPKIAAPAPDQPLQRVQGRALCVVQWCPSAHADNSWHGWNLCEVHFADLMNANVLVVRDATGDVLAEEASAYLRRNGGAA